MIVVTSAHAKAGKTTAVFNLGLRLAESGYRVLVIDGDLRRPTLGPIFGFDRATGLGDILAEGFDIAVVKEIIRETTFPGLFVLTAQFLAQRGFCCERGCRHCPYEGTDR